MTNEEIKLDDSWLEFAKTYLTGNSILIGVETFQQTAIKALEEEESLILEKYQGDNFVKAGKISGISKAIEIIKKLKAPENAS